MDTSNCTAAVGTGCKDCKPGYELDKFVPGKFTKCIKKPSIMPVKRVVPTPKVDDWADFGNFSSSDWDTDFSSSSSSSSSESSSESSRSSSESSSSSSSDFSWGDDWSTSW